MSNVYLPKRLEPWFSDSVRAASQKVFKTIPHFSLFYFGSRVNGTHRPMSDIDIGIESKEKIPGELISKFEDELFALPHLYKVEVVDFSRVSDDFKKVAEHRILIK